MVSGQKRLAIHEQWLVQQRVGVEGSLGQRRCVELTSQVAGAREVRRYRFDSEIEGVKC